MEKQFRVLEKKAKRDLRGAVVERSADMRYRGQSFELNVPWGGDFHAAHEKMYGYHDAARAVEVVTLRVRAKLLNEAAVTFPTAAAAAGLGPAILPDYGSTTLDPVGWHYRRDGWSLEETTPQERLATFFAAVDELGERPYHTPIDL